MRNIVHRPPAISGNASSLLPVRSIYQAGGQCANKGLDP